MKFVNYTEEEIAVIEKSGYAVQYGSNVYLHNGRGIFTYDIAEYFYKKLKSKFRKEFKNGSNEKREIAMFKLATLRIVPIRFS